MSAINASTVNNINGNANSSRIENDFQNNGSATAKRHATDSITDKIITESVTKVDRAEQQEKVQITSAQLESVAQNLQDFVGEMNKGLEFSVDKDSGRDVIKVIDRKSGDLIKQYPTEEVLDLVSKLSEATGNFINTDV